MDIKKLSIDIAIAILSQGANALVSALLTLLLPKLLGVEGFGYWQLFIFYASYVGLFHLGLNDGVYLVEGGRGRNEIDKRSINSQFFFGAVIELFFSLALIVFAVFVPLEYDRKIVILATGILVPVCNTATFIGYVHQAMNETKLYSYSVLGESLVLLLGLILLMADGCTDYMTYIELYLIAKILRLLFCAVFLLTFQVRFFAVKETVRLSIADIRVGVSLMVANIAGSLVVGIARFAIDGNWDIATFSVASLALSITTFFMMFISQASMVLFPSLRQSCDINLGIAFRKMRDGLNLVLPLLLLAFYPAKYFLEIWLPDYQSAIGLFLFVFPLCIFEGKMDIWVLLFLRYLGWKKPIENQFGIDVGDFCLGLGFNLYFSFGRIDPSFNGDRLVRQGTLYRVHYFSKATGKIFILQLFGSSSQFVVRWGCVYRFRCHFRVTLRMCLYTVFTLFHKGEMFELE